MSRLLSSGFVRLFKNKLFWTGIIVSAVLGICAAYTKYTEEIEGFPTDLSYVLYSYAYIAAIALAVISPMFSGTEYSDGTIRNKIIAGHKRINIYFSNMIFSAVSTLFFVLCYVIPYTILYLILVGHCETPLSQLFLYFGLSLLSLLALCAIFNAVVMLVAKKAAAAVSCLLLAAAAFMAALMIYARLSAPEYYSDYTMSVDGEIVSVEERNSRYLTGTKRIVYEIAYDILPTGQLWQVLTLEVKRPGAAAAYALVLCIVITTAGVFVFQKKDLS